MTSDIDLIREAFSTWLLCDPLFQEWKALNSDAAKSYHVAIPAFRRVLLKHVRCAATKLAPDYNQPCGTMKVYPLGYGCGTCDACKLIAVLMEAER